MVGRRGNTHTHAARTSQAPKRDVCKAHRQQPACSCVCPSRFQRQNIGSQRTATSSPTRTPTHTATHTHTRLAYNIFHSPESDSPTSVCVAVAAARRVGALALRRLRSERCARSRRVKTLVVSRVSCRRWCARFVLCVARRVFRRTFFGYVALRFVRLLVAAVVV